MSTAESPFNFAALIPLFGDIFSSMFAPNQSPTEGTFRGADEFLRDLNRGSGFGVTNPQDIANYFSMASRFLSGQQKQDYGQAGQSAFATAAASGITNPYAMTQHAKNQVGQNYAGQFGNLSLQEALAQLQQSQKNAQLRSQLIGMGGQLDTSERDTIPGYMKPRPSTPFGNSGGNWPWNK